MNALFKVFLFAALVCFATAQESSLPQPDDQSVIGVGCFCVKSNDTLNVGTSQSNLLDCFCMNNFEDLPVNNNTQDGDFNSMINPFANISGQAALVCTCAYPRSPNPNVRNASFLIPGYNGSSDVPVNCTCARAIDYLPTIIPPEITIPILDITIPIPFSDANKTFDQLVPLGCFCSSRLDLLSGVNIMGYTPSLPALFCKCLPALNVSSGELAVLGSDLNVDLTDVSLPGLGLSFDGFNASTILGNLTLGSIPAGIVFPNTSFTIPFLDITVTPPPFFNIGPSQPGQ